MYPAGILNQFSDCSLCPYEAVVEVNRNWMLCLIVFYIIDQYKLVNFSLKTQQESLDLIFLLIDDVVMEGETKNW